MTPGSRAMANSHARTTRNRKWLRTENSHRASSSAATRIIRIVPARRTERRSKRTLTSSLSLVVGTTTVGVDGPVVVPSGVIPSVVIASPARVGTGDIHLSSARFLV
jgi:anti-sigma factor RsiW